MFVCLCVFVLVFFLALLIPPPACAWLPSTWNADCANRASSAEAFFTFYTEFIEAKFASPMYLSDQAPRSPARDPPPKHFRVSNTPFQKTPTGSGLQKIGDPGFWPPQATQSLLCVTSFGRCSQIGGMLKEQS